jgi:hypothetical protein
VTPNQTISYIYENVKTVTITIEYTDLDGNTHTQTLDTIDADYQVGSGSINLNLAGPGFGYGDYVVTIAGEHESALGDEDSIQFSFYPVTGTVAENENDDNATATLDYDDTNTDIERIEIIVKDADGNPVPELPTITVAPTDKTATIPFGDNHAPAGKYKIEIIAYDANGEMSEPYVVDYEYSPTKAPNTGGLLAGLNISKADYLATGLIAFFVAGVAGLIVIIRSSKNQKRRR